MGFHWLQRANRQHGFQRAGLVGLKGYVPGEQVAGDSSIKLNTNENPYPPSPKVGEALRKIEVEHLRRYPQALAEDFREVAATVHRGHGIVTENIIPTNGGDELLRLAVTTFVQPGEQVLVMVPGYSLYPVLVGVQGGRLRQVPLAADFSMPDGFMDFIKGSRAKMLMLVNPHAPSGRLLPVESTQSKVGLADIVKGFKGLVVLDEAYVDFIDPELGYDSLSLLRDAHNLLVLRTMSKGYSLAGLRFGYGIGAKSLVEPMLYKTRDSYNTGYLSQILATAALADQDHARDTAARVRQGRQALSAGLHALGFTLPPSQANFVLAQLPDARDNIARRQTGMSSNRSTVSPLSSISAKYLYGELKARKILVRYFDEPRLRHALRISVGSAEENQLLLEAIDDILQRPLCSSPH